MRQHNHTERPLVLPDTVEYILIWSRLSQVQTNRLQIHHTSHKVGAYCLSIDKLEDNNFSCIEDSHVENMSLWKQSYFSIIASVLC